MSAQGQGTGLQMGQMPTQPQGPLGSGAMPPSPMPPTLNHPPQGMPPQGMPPQMGQGMPPPMTDGGGGFFGRPQFGGMSPIQQYLARQRGQ